jgi:hypothetical protein
MSDDLKRTRVATHEAGHLAMAFVWGRRLGVSSIEPTEHYSGIAFHSPARRSKGAFDAFKPVPMQPALARRAIESTIMIYLAGPAAEWWLAPTEPVTGFVPEDPDKGAAAALARLASPSPSEAERLARAARDSHEPDEVQAQGLAVAFADEPTAFAYLRWLEEETRRIVRSGRFARLTHALVPELLLHTTISGRLARRVLADADEAYFRGD